MSPMFAAGLPLHDHQVGILARRDRADAVGEPEIGRAVQRPDADRFDRCEAGLDQQLELALVAEARDDAAVAGRIGPGDQQAAAATNCRSRPRSFLYASADSLAARRPGAAGGQVARDRDRIPSPAGVSTSICRAWSGACSGTLCSNTGSVEVIAT